LRRDVAAPRKFTARVFAYLDHVHRDRQLPAAAKAVAYVVSQHWNEKKGDAFMSTKTIAAEAGLGQTHVRRMLPHLVARGHMRIDYGSRGSGHPNRYWPIEPTTAQLSDAIEPQVIAIEPPLAMNHLQHNGAPPARRTGYVDREEKSNLDPVRIFDALEDVYPLDLSDSTAASKKLILAKLLKEGADPAEIITAAKAYGDHLSQNGGETLPMDVWLKRRSWEQRNGSCQGKPASADTPRQ
jgi:hypothetical protein